MLAVGRVVGAEVRDAVDPDRLQPVVGVERRLGHRHMVAPAVVGQHRLAAGAHPVHRPPELARREGDGEILRIVEALDPEAAADVRRRHPHRLRRQAQLARPARRAAPRRPGRRSRRAAAPPSHSAIAAARLHRHRHHPVVDQLEPRGVRRRRERRRRPPPRRRTPSRRRRCPAPRGGSPARPRRSPHAPAGRRSRRRSAPPRPSPPPGVSATTSAIASPA